MFANKHKVLGILGGMGPQATMDLYNNILRYTKIEKEQDHVSTLIFSNPKIPDRSESFCNDDTSKMIQFLQSSAKLLEQGGADLLLIPCHSSHAYFDAIASSVQTPVLNMVKETIDYVRDNRIGQKIVGLLATTATYRSGVYHEYAAQHNVEIVLPDSASRELIMNSIYNIKVGKNIDIAKRDLVKVVKQLNVPTIMGCTEIPLVLGGTDSTLPLVNPAELLAKAALKRLNHSINER